MAVRRQTRIVIQEADDIGYQFLTKLLELVENKPGRRSNINIVPKTHRVSHTQEEIDLPIPKVNKDLKVFLYLHLRNISNIPPGLNEKVLSLRNGDRDISTLQHSSTSSQFYGQNSYPISDSEIDKPTFILSLNQDSMEDLGMMGDNPLCITMFERIPKRHSIQSYDSQLRGKAEHEADGEEEEYEQYDNVPIAKGYIDLLQFFSKRRRPTLLSMYLYPLIDSTKSEKENFASCKIEWEIYSVLPLLKNIVFCNIIYLTFESIYNASPALLSNADNLTANIYLQSKYPNFDNELKKELICSYKLFIPQIIEKQNRNFVWESLVTLDKRNENHISYFSHHSIPEHSFFINLLGTESVQFFFNEINLKTDIALVCNAMHRFILTKENQIRLENIINSNKQKFMVEIVSKNDPTTILLEGCVDLDVFLYPKVNTCRFAVELKEPEKSSRMQGSLISTSSRTSRKIQKKKLSAKLKSITSIEHNAAHVRKPFAILNICMPSPITEISENISIYPDSTLTSEKLKECRKLTEEPEKKPLHQFCEESYKDFDETVKIIIEFINVNKVRCINDAKEQLCCFSKNLINKIMKLICCDFNIRFPTKTNMEFTKLLTTVYNELEDRIYKNLELPHFMNAIDKNDTTEQILMINVVKYLYEVGDNVMADFVLENIKRRYNNYIDLDFYLFLYDVENENYEAVKEYLAKPLAEVPQSAEYYLELIKIYLEYMEIKANEQTFNQALEELLRKLEKHAHQYPEDINCWILLHSLYRQCSYRPGMSYTRWKYENMFEMQSMTFPTIPISKWKIYNNYNLTFASNINIAFQKSMNTFLSLGLYKFAEVIFDKISSDCEYFEKNFMSKTFDILLHKQISRRLSSNFPKEKITNNDYVRGFQAQINGNFAYACGNYSAAMQSYENLLNLGTSINFENYQLGLLRYGYSKLNDGDYEQANKAFQNCCIKDSNCLVPYFNIGKVMYKLQKFESAEKYFSLSTNFKIHVPDIWAYLALVNLKLKNNLKALEFWKYAKLNPDNVISEEILLELSEIDYNNVDLIIE